MSVNEDPSTWRLITGDVPYKLINGFPTGTINEETGQVEEKYIIQASDLRAFIAISFPLGIALDQENIYLTPNRRYPGSVAFVTQSVRWESLDSSKPCDPYGADPGAPVGTYCPFLTLTITYVTGKKQDDENDATTLLEVSADASGEFLMYPIRGLAKWGAANGPAAQGAQLPASKLVPTTQWTVRWPRINRVFLPRIITAMRNRIGTVNNAAMPMFLNAAAETILFAGYSYREDYTWREGWEDTPASIDLKFVEKRVVQGADVVGHNHFFREETGEFVKLFMPGGGLVYHSSNLNNIFPPAVKETD